MERAGDLDALRAAFADWTVALTPVVASFGLTKSKGVIYEHYCAMAVENQGATWLQTGEEVRNPYMGCDDAALHQRDGGRLGRLGARAVVGHTTVGNPRCVPAQLGRVWDGYRKVQTALADDDLATTHAAAGALSAMLDKIDDAVLDDEARAAWGRERANLRAAVDRMTAAKELEPLRSGFALLSEEMPVIFEMFGPEVDADVYRMHCPMAFDGRGADWLQAGEDIRNPYFGASMIRCATDVERIASAARDRPPGRATMSEPAPTALNRVIRFCLVNKLVVALVVVAVTAWGAMVAPFDWDLGGLPRDPVPTDAIPDIGENQQIVFTEWVGRSPQDIEDQITYPLTVNLLGIPGVKTIRSYSFFGFSSIYIILE